MLKKRIIPCLDMKSGKVVKGIQFQDLKDLGNPIKLAQYYSDNGADELCLLDITASSDNRDAQYSIINDVAKCCAIPFGAGGGIRSINDVEKILMSGADKVLIGTAALHNQNLVQEVAYRFGSQCVIVSIDAIKKNNQYVISTHGSRNITNIDAVKFAKQIEACGAGEILLNSVLTDGCKNGFDNVLNKLIANSVNIPVIASGGAGTYDHFIDAIIDGNTSAVLAASVFHNKEIEIMKLKSYMLDKGIMVRI